MKEDCTSYYLKGGIQSCTYSDLFDISSAKPHDFERSQKGTSQSLAGKHLTRDCFQGKGEDTRNQLGTKPHDLMCLPVLPGHHVLPNITFSFGRCYGLMPLSDSRNFEVSSIDHATESPAWTLELSVGCQNPRINWSRQSIIEPVNTLGRGARGFYPSGVLRG